MNAMVLGLSRSTASSATDAASSMRNSCAAARALPGANAASPRSKAANFQAFIMRSFSNSADYPRYIRDRCVAAFGTRAHRDRAGAGPDIADHARRDWIGRSSIVQAAATDRAV